MFKLFQKQKQTKIDPQQLLTDTDYALNDIGAAASDALMNRLGLTREQVFDAVMSDDEVSACFEDVVSALLASPWRVYGEDAEEAQINQIYKNLREHLPQIAFQVVIAKLCGYSVARVLYEQDETGFVRLKKIISRHDELSSYQPKFDRLIYQSANGEQEIDTKVTHLFLTHHATSKNPAGEMALARIYPAVMLRKDGWRYAYQFTRRYAQPYLVAKTDDAQGAQKMFAFLNGGGTQIGHEDEIVMLQNSATGDFFSRLEQMANARIQKAILGRVKTSELNNSSRAAQEVEQNAQQDRIEAYLILLANAVQHLIDALLLLNTHFGNGIQNKNGLIFEYQEEIKVDKTRAERDEIYAKMGLMFTAEYYEEQLGLDRRYFTVTLPENETNTTNNALTLALSGGDDTQMQTIEDGETRILAPKIKAIENALNESADFNDFQTKLTALKLDNDSDLKMIEQLVSDSVKEYVSGCLNG